MCPLFHRADVEANTPAASEQHFALEHPSALQTVVGGPPTSVSATRLPEGMGLNQQLIGQHQQALVMPASERPLRQDSKASASGSAVSAPHPDAVRAAVERITDWLAHVESPDPSLRLAPTPKPEPGDCASANFSPPNVRETSAMTASRGTSHPDSSRNQQQFQSSDEERFLREQFGQETLDRLRSQLGSTSALGVQNPQQELLIVSQSPANTPSLPTPSAIVAPGGGAQRDSFFSNQSQVYAQLLSGPASPHVADAAAHQPQQPAGQNRHFSKNASEQRELHGSRESSTAATAFTHIGAARRPANLPTDCRQSTSPQQQKFIADASASAAADMQQQQTVPMSPSSENPALAMGLSVQSPTSDELQAPSNAENTHTLHLPERPRQIDPRAARGLLFETPLQHQQTFGSSCLALLATSGVPGATDSSLALQMLHQVHPQGEPVPLFPASLYDSPPHPHSNRLSSQSPLRQPPQAQQAFMTLGPYAGMNQQQPVVAGPDANALLLHYPPQPDLRQSVESISARSRCAALFAGSSKASASTHKKSRSSHHKSSKTVIGLPCTRKSYAVGEDLASCENLYNKRPVAAPTAANQSIATGSNAAGGLVLQNPHARSSFSMPLQQPVGAAAPRMLTAKEMKKLKGKKGASSEVCFPATYQHPLLSSLPAGAGLGSHPLLLRQPPQNPASTSPSVAASAPGSALRLNSHPSAGSMMALQQQQQQHRLSHLQLPTRAQPLQEHANSDIGALPFPVPLAAAAHQRTLLSASKTFAALSTLTEHQPLRSNPYLNEAPISCSALSRTSAPMTPLNEAAANASDTTRGAGGPSGRHDTRLSLSSFLARVPPAEQQARRGRLRMDVASDTGTAGTNSSVVLGGGLPFTHQMSYNALANNVQTRLSMRQFLISRDARSSVLRRLAAKQHSSASSTVVSKGSGSKGSKQQPAAGKNNCYHLVY